MDKLKNKIEASIFLFVAIMYVFPVFGQEKVYDWTKQHSIYIREADSIKNIYGEYSEEYCIALNNLVYTYVYFGAKYDYALSSALNLRNISKQIYGEYSTDYSYALGTTCKIYNLLEKYDTTISLSKNFIFWAPKDSVTSNLLFEYANALGHNKYNYDEALSVSKDAIRRLHNINDSILFVSKISQLYLEYDNADAAKREIENLSNVVEQCSDYPKCVYYSTLGDIYSDIDEELSYSYYCKADSFAQDPHDRLLILRNKAKVAPSHLVSEECLLNALALQAYYLGKNDSFAADIYTELGQMYEKIGKCSHGIYAYNKALEITHNNNLLFGRTAVSVWGKFAHFLKSKNTLLNLGNDKNALSLQETIKLAKQFDEFASAISMEAYGPGHPICELQHIRLAEDYLLMNMPDSALFWLPSRPSYEKPSEYLFGYESYIRGACAFMKQDYPACDTLLMHCVLNSNEKTKDAYELLIKSKYNQRENIYAHRYSSEYHNIITDEYLRKLITLTEDERNNYILLLGKDANSLYPYICDNKSTELSLRLSLFCKGLLFSTSSSIRRIVFQNENSYKLFKILQRKKQELYEQQLADTNLDRKLKHSIDSMELKLSKEFIKLESLRQELDIPISELQSSLNSDELAIDFEQVDNNTLIAYILKNKGVSLKTIIMPSTNDKSIICTNILNSLEPEICNFKRVYFSPVGQLNLINIESYARKRIRDVEFHRISHLYRLLSEKKYQIREIVALGNPRFNDELVLSTERGKTFGPLPGTKIEVETIRKAMGVKNVITHLYTEEEANENNLKKYDGTSVNVLHIATHGYYLSKKNETGLLLTGANRGINEAKISNLYEDGILTTSEIEQMSFPALQLVVLSACDTGLGETNIDGVWGLQRAFRIAGAQNLIVSLKKVDDEGTLNFMTDFYTRLSQTNSIYKSFVYAQDNADEEIRNSFILVE